MEKVEYVPTAPTRADELITQAQAAAKTGLGVSAALLGADTNGVATKRVEVLPSRERVVVTEADAARGLPREIEHDMLLTVIDGKEVRRTVKHYYITDDRQVDHYLAWLETLPRLRNGMREIGWDTETSGIHWYEEEVATEQFGALKGDDPRAYTIDVRCLSEQGLRRVMAPVEDPSFIKYGQNLKFESLYVMHGIAMGAATKEEARRAPRLVLRPKNLVDTQITELVMRPGLFEGGNAGVGGGSGDGQNRKAYGMCSMAKLMRRYAGGIDIDKDHDLRVSFYTTPKGMHNTRQILYAGGDVIHPFTIFAEQRKEIAARALRSILAVEFELIPVLAEMEINGMAFNQAAWVTLWQEAVERQDKVEHVLDKLFLSIQGTLFDEVNLPDVPSKNCTVCDGKGKRAGSRVDCDTCGGTGRVRSGIRPLYYAGKGKNAKPRPLNWGSSAQVKWAIEQYCAAVGWHIELVTTERQLLDVKRKLGVSWLVKKGKLAYDEDQNLIDGKTHELIKGIPDEMADEIPDYVVPEDSYCILLGTDADTLTLRKLRGQLPENLIALILEYSETKSKLGTFGIDFLNNVHDDGRVRFEFHQALASTGRLSASPNSMNIPRDKRYRDCFVAARGKRLCIADYSQQEPRVSAFVSGDPVYSRNYLDGADLYITIAEEMLGYRPDPDAEDPDFQKRSKKDRQAVKSTALGLAYRMGAGKLRDKLTLDMDEPVPFDRAADLHKGYLERCFGIKEFQEMCHRKADPQNPAATRIWDAMLGEAVTFIESPCGRKRFFPPDSKNVYTEACNLPIQAAGATMTKSAMCLIAREVELRGWVGRAYLVNAIHDELVMEADTEIATECAAMMKECMERAGSFYVPTIPMVASFPKHTDGTADRWLKE